LRFPDETETILTGAILSYGMLQLNEGWNIVSGFSFSVPVNSIIDPDNLIVSGTVYGFDGSYFNAETIEPGYGYWLRSTGEGEITISSSAPLTKSRFFQPPEHFNTLTLENMDLYFGNNIEVENVLSYSLPPKPPAPARDIRFSGNTKLCTTDECVVEVMNDGSPLTFDCDIKDGESWEIVDESGKVFECSGAQVLELSGESEQWLLRKSTTTIPTTFALHPAYPNPFNPVTTIKYSVQKPGYLYITIHNLLGKTIITLVEKQTVPGTYTINWDGFNDNNSPVSSGLYFITYIVDSQNSEQLFAQRQKIVLLR